MPDEQVFQRITGDPSVNETIAESANETPEQPWNETDIQELTLDATNIELDMDNIVLLARLLNYFQIETKRIIKESD